MPSVDCCSKASPASLPACTALPGGSLGVFTLLLRASSSKVPKGTPVHLRSGYLRAAAVLGSSLRKWLVEDAPSRQTATSHASSATSIGRFVMFPNDQPPSNEVVQHLEWAAGWTACCVEERVEPAQQEWRKTGAKWAGTFLKLALFKLRQFERVLFVDGDTLAVGPIHASWLHSHVQLSIGPADCRELRHFKLGKPPSKGRHSHLQQRRDAHTTLASAI